MTSSFATSTLRGNLEHDDPRLDRDAFNRVGDSPAQEPLHRRACEKFQERSGQRLPTDRKALNVEPEEAVLPSGCSDFEAGSGQKMQPDWSLQPSRRNEARERSCRRGR